ncbi:MAG: rhodanese-like domain-containing protein [Bacteroidales bacterium]|nr:rhodanese-like domain-containing protein [Bacteroidales bacterium]
MKHSLITLIAAFLGSLLGCNAAEFKSVTPPEFQEVIADTAVQVLDSRTAEEYADGHIARAINIDVLKDDFADIATKTLDARRTVAVYCRSGRRSKKAAQILTEKGYTVIELNKGYLSWIDAKMPVTK